MAVNRSITVYIDSGTNAETAMTLMRRLMSHGENAGTCVSTFGAVTAGTRTDQVKVQVGSGGTNTLSTSLVVDSAVTEDKWLELIGRVFDACRSAGTCTSTFAASYTEGSRSDSLKCAIT